MEEETGVPQAEGTADVSPASEQPVEAAPDSQESVGADVQTQEPAQTANEQRVPYSRFKEVNDELKQLKDQLNSFQAQPETLSLPQYQAPTSVEAEAEAKLQEIVGKAISNQLGDVVQTVRQQRVDSQIETARKRFPDFDQHMVEVSEILKSSPSLKYDEDALGKAYLMAKGLKASQSVDEARKQGVQEAYQTIDQKIAGRPNQPTPRKMSGESDLLKRFKSGQLSEAQVRDNWTRLQEELASSRE